jgi:hypothetical protein
MEIPGGIVTSSDVDLARAETRSAQPDNSLGLSETERSLQFQIPFQRESVAVAVARKLPLRFEGNGKYE